MDLSPAPLLRVPRRTPRACKQCRAAKLRCSGARPCDRCERRHQPCVFQSDEPHVSIPEKYLRELQRRVAAAGLHCAVQEPLQPCAVPQQPPNLPRGDSRPPEINETVSSPQRSPVQTHVSTPSPSTTHHRADVNAVPTGSNHASVNSLSGVSADVVSSSPNTSFLPHNPLVARNLSYIRDTKGRPLYLGPTSTWSFHRRAVTLLEAQSPYCNGSSAPLNLDGTAFRLQWKSKSVVEPSDLKNLPAMDYALYLYNTVKFHLGELSGIIDEAHFLASFERFHRNPWETAQAQQLWFIEYLLVLAFGKAFLAPTNHSAAAPPGSEFAARAMALLPDPAQLHDEHMLAISVVALIALYFYSIDMRMAAYQYIGQALRLSFIEGIHHQITDDVVTPAYATHCNTVWWTVYVLDQELTALTGVPPSVPADITAALPSERSSSLPAKALTLRIRLSRLIASMCSTVYSLEQGLGTTFARTTTTVLQHLAAIPRELDAVVSTNASTTDLPHMFRHTTLSYHHCIVLATRPLTMWLLLLSLPPPTPPLSPQHLPPLVATLLQTAADSASTILLTLKSLAECDMLETFLPFHLEYAFSAATLLSLLAATLPAFVQNDAWTDAVHFVLDDMVRKKNGVAALRKAELEHLAGLLEGAGAEHADGFGAQDLQGWDVLGGSALPDAGQMEELLERLEAGDLLEGFF